MTDAREMVDGAFDDYERTVSAMSTTLYELARVTSAYRAKAGETKVAKRRLASKPPLPIIEAMTDADPEVNALLREKMELEGDLAVVKERLWVLKQKLEQGRSWTVTERVTDQMEADWGQG